MAQEIHTSPPMKQLLERQQGHVLSSEDIKYEILGRNLLYVKDTIEGKEVPRELTPSERKDSVQGDCYDLRIGYVVGKRFGIKKGTGAVALEPGEMVTLLSKEWVKLPANICALVIPRNRPARRGLLVLNAGHIDPNYEGQIMAQVVNLSSQERSIQLEDSMQGVFSVVFSYVRTPSRKKRASQESIGKRLAEIAADIGEQPMGLAIAESVMEKRFVPRSEFTKLLMERVFLLILLVAALMAIMSGTGVIKISAFPIKAWSVPLWVSSIIVFTIICVVCAFFVPAISFLLRKSSFFIGSWWPWWREHMMP